jgi:hypothetical protein
MQVAKSHPMIEAAHTRRKAEIVNWECPGCGSKIKHATSVFTHKKKCARFTEMQDKNIRKDAAGITKRAQSSRPLPHTSRFLVSALMGVNEEWVCTPRLTQLTKVEKDAHLYKWTCHGCMNVMQNFSMILEHQKYCTRHIPLREKASLKSVAEPIQRIL